MAATQLIEMDGPGTVLEVTNDTDSYMDVLYASVTARKIMCLRVFIGDRLHDCVFAGAGGSHSWWMNAGGKLLDHNGLDPGETLKITCDGPCAFRIDWV